MPTRLLRFLTRACLDNRNRNPAELTRLVGRIAAFSVEQVLYCGVSSPVRPAPLCGRATKFVCSLDLPLLYKVRVLSQLPSSEFSWISTNLPKGGVFQGNPA